MKSDCTEKQENIELREQLNEVIGIAFGILNNANRLYEIVLELMKYNQQLKDTINMVTTMLGGEDSPIIKGMVDSAMKTIDEYQLPEDLKQMVDAANAQMSFI